MFLSKYKCYFYFLHNICLFFHLKSFTQKQKYNIRLLLRERKNFEIRCPFDYILTVQRKPLGLFLSFFLSLFTLSSRYVKINRFRAARSYVCGNIFVFQLMPKFPTQEETYSGNFTFPTLAGCADVTLRRSVTT